MSSAGAPEGVVSLELVLDGEAERRIRREWEALAALGLSSMAAHTAASNRPHITLLVRSEVPELAPDELAAMLPLVLEVGAPVLFGAGDRRVLARTVVPSAPLLAVHAAVHRAARSVHPSGSASVDAPHTAPGEWTPHITLARRLRVTQIAEALAVLGGSIPARAVGLRRWDSRTRTVTTLLSAEDDPVAPSDG